MQSSSAVAACVVRGNSIYLYYRPANGPYTQPLFVLSPQPPLSSSGSNTGSSTTASGPINPYAPSSLSQTNSYSHDYTAIITASKSDDERTLDAVPDIGPTAPSSGGDSALFIQVQNIYNSGPSLGDLGRQASRVSIATTSSFDGRTVTYGLLLALNPSSGSSLLVQMNSQSPTTGNRQNSSFSDSPWTLNTLSPQSSAFEYATQFWLAASASSAPEGSSVYQVFTTQESPVPLFGRYNVANQLIIVDSNFNPGQIEVYRTMIKLTGITGFDAAVIGDSGIQLVDINGSLSYVMAISNPYDPTACFTSANGQIIKATQGTIQTTIVDRSFPNGAWSSHPPPKSLPSPILTCATLGNTLYAVVQGDSDGMPKVYTAEMNDWTWRPRQLFNFDNSGNGSGRGGGSVGEISTDHTRSNGFSTGAIVGIVIVVVAVVLGGIGFWWLMKRRRAAKDLKALNGRAEKITVLPPPPPGAGGVIMPGQQMYPPAYAAGQAPPPPVSVSMSPQVNYHQQVPSSAAGWTTAVYPPSTRPGEHIPMVASSLASAPPTPLTHINNHIVYSSAGSSIPSTPVYSPTSPIVGDKQELTSEDTTILPASSAVGHHQRPSTAMSHNSYQEGSSNTLLSAVSQPAGTGRSDGRMQEMFSPALANAQLILQRSQSPPNQTYQELQQPYHQ